MDRGNNEEYSRAMGRVLTCHNKTLRMEEPVYVRIMVWTDCQQDLKCKASLMLDGKSYNLLISAFGGDLIHCFEMGLEDNT